MPILVCAATSFEIEPTLSFIQQKKLNNNVAVLITGVGLTVATYNLTRYVLTKWPRLIIQAGTAGSLNKNIPLAKNVVVNQDCIGDLGVLENDQFKNIFDLGLVGKESVPWTNEKLVNIHSELLNLAGLQKVNSVTVNEITTDNNRISYYKNKLGAEIETMEGAALHYVALMENIPFIQLRSISNFVGERDKTKWKLKESIDQLNIELQQFLMKLLEL